MADLTPTQRLAELLLDESLEEFVRSRRDHTSWRRIAKELHDATDGEIDVTQEILRRWYPDPPKTVEATA